MAHGLKILGRDGTVRLDTSNVTETIIDQFSVGAGTTGLSGTHPVVRTYPDIPDDMTIRAIVVQITDVAVHFQQFIPTVAINQGAKTVTVTGFTGNIPEPQTPEGVGVRYRKNVTVQLSQTAACNIIVVGK